MTYPTEIHTERLLLRRWIPSDRQAFADLNADPRVMEHFPSLLTREQSDAVVDRFEHHFAERGFGFWAVEVNGVAQFAGFVGLSVPLFDAHFTPCVEVGWRLAHSFWNRGYASEAARAALRFGFDTLQVKEIVAFTVPANRRSRRVMEKLGMSYNRADDFDHPDMPADHPLRRHVLYRIRSAQFPPP